MRVSELVRQGAATMGSLAESRTLAAYVLDVELPQLLVAPDATPQHVVEFERLVERRVEGVPLQHLTGEAWFRTVRVRVGPGVFIPRPETEVMVGWALDRLGERSVAPVVVELCAGSGAISLALSTEFPAAEVHAVEMSDDAMDYLRDNLRGVPVEVVNADMADAFGELNGQVDLVIANPPYVPVSHWADLPPDVRDHDPVIALVSGEDGLDAMRTVAQAAARLLRPGGWVCAEHADVQGKSAPQVFVDHGAFRQVSDEFDLTGRPRFVTARRTGRMGS